MRCMLLHMPEVVEGACCVSEAVEDVLCSLELKVTRCMLLCTLEVTECVCCVLGAVKGVLHVEGVRCVVLRLLEAVEGVPRAEAVEVVLYLSQVLEVMRCALDVGDCALRAGSSGGCALCDALYTGGRGDVRRVEMWVCQPLGLPHNARVPWRMTCVYIIWASPSSSSKTINELISRIFQDAACWRPWRAYTMCWSC